MKPREFAELVAAERHSNVFNPYAELCAAFDVPGAPEIRKTNLEIMIQRGTESGVASLWVGRDLGHRGGRRTGLALTDDLRFELHLSRWGISSPVRPTRGPLLAEQTAATIWHVLSRISDPVFLWNVFPFHPHVPHQPFSNRPHTKAELAVGLEILDQLASTLSPESVIAVGADAYRACVRLFDPSKVYGVRHPSYGGNRMFTQQILDRYKLPYVISAP